MIAAGAAVLAQDQAALAVTLAGLLCDPVKLAAFNRAALDFAGRQDDQLSAALDLVRPLLPAS